MEQQLGQIRDKQKASWNQFSAGWKKWDGLVMDFVKPVADEIIQLLHPQNNDLILDVASGTGEPGLTIASLLKGGKVILTDLAEDMLKVARENAAQRGITNIETLVCDVSELPFEDNSFDAVSCRFGFMFFPDMLLATKELARVLKPGGRMVTAVWNVPEKNFWVSAIMGDISINMQVPTPPAGAPGMFRCAQDGLIAGLFKQAGLKNILQKEVTGKLNCKTADAYWSMQTEVAAPVATALNKASDEMKEKIKRDVYEALKQKYPDGNIVIDSSALVIYGEK
jgi:ubiquinone/menaquinone biosynthesis C-methylase UbiE